MTKQRSSVHDTKIGDRYGRLIILSHTKKRYSFCLCDCGSTKEIRNDSLHRGDTKSCGCLSREISSENGKKMRTHGLSNSKVWSTWKDMIRRCYKPNCKVYKNYGARGIVVCDRWKGYEGFLNFVEDMGIPDKEDTLERIEVNKNYEPSNCKWEKNLSVQTFNQHIKSSNTSTKTGVRKADNKWQAYINKEGIFYNLGRYENFEDAVEARIKGELLHYGFVRYDVNTNIKEN